MIVDDLPDIVRNKAITTGHADWLDGLPALVADLEREWDLAVGPPYQGGTEALVAPAMCGDGTEAVLKLLVPHDHDAAGREIAVLELAAGQGCAALLRSDVDRGAMRLERLGAPRYDLRRPLRERLPILVETAARVWRPAPDAGLPTGADKGRWLIDHITTAWDDLDWPCAEQTVDHAVACAERRVAAHDDERAVLVHGDVHQWNALVATEGFKLVDPDGYLAEPEYDLGILMREDAIELMEGDPTERARWLAERTGLDADAIWEWGVVERVATGLVATSIDLQPEGREMLAAADRIAMRSRGQSSVR